MRVRFLATVSSGMMVVACGSTPQLAAKQTSRVLGNRLDPRTAPALDHEEAMTRWRNAAPTGATIEQTLAQLPEDPAVRRAMALAVLRGGDLMCEDVVEQYGCSDSYFELAPLAPTATFESPCLRRQLALWAIDQLEPADAAELSNELIAMVSMRSPETELPAAAFKLVGADDALRLMLLRHADADLAETEAAGLVSPEARGHAASQLHLNSATESLDLTHHRELVLGAMNDDALYNSTRARMIDLVADDRGADTTAALLEVTEDADCDLAMRAASLLAEHGDPSRLPARPRSADAAEHAHALCMLKHDDDEARRATRLAAWFGPAGLSTVDETYDYWSSALDLDGDGDVTDAERDAGIGRTVDDATGVVTEFDGSMITTTTPIAAADVDPSIVTDRIWHDGTCTGLTCEFGDSSIELTPAPDGSLYVTSVSVRNEEYGCGC